MYSDDIDPPSLINPTLLMQLSRKILQSLCRTNQMKENAETEILLNNKNQRGWHATADSNTIPDR